MAKKQSRKKRRKLGPFHIVSDPGKRNNPQSLRKVLYELTQVRYGRELQSAAMHLQSLLRRRHGRTLHANFSDEILYNILNDRTHIKYYHLEGYARSLDIPIALLLLYSRLVANQEDATPHLSVAMISAFKKVLNEASRTLSQKRDDKSAFQIGDLLQWSTIYENEIAHSEQRNLFSSDDE